MKGDHCDGRRGNSVRAIIKFVTLLEEVSKSSNLTTDVLTRNNTFLGDDDAEPNVVVALFVFG